MQTSEEKTCRRSSRPCDSPARSAALGEAALRDVEQVTERFAADAQFSFFDQAPAMSGQPRAVAIRIRMLSFDQKSGHRFHRVAARGLELAERFGIDAARETGLGAGNQKFLGICAIVAGIGGLRKIPIAMVRKQKEAEFHTAPLTAVRNAVAKLNQVLFLLDHSRQPPMRAKRSIHTPVSVPRLG
ncbi:MAG TPA: hypothetical protein VMF30_04200, partial [Pirellulales bacterium]|nr:hypothetical protein [Pirellulales bacterium]